MTPSYDTPPVSVATSPAVLSPAPEPHSRTEMVGGAGTHPAQDFTTGRG